MEYTCTPNNSICASYKTRDSHRTTVKQGGVWCFPGAMCPAVWGIKATGTVVHCQLLQPYNRDTCMRLGCSVVYTRMLLDAERAATSAAVTIESRWL